ncbi:MAG: hypothetical protein K2O90_06510 [Limosilactobacillus sp.]|nr:hypothetical protein [Limosilactobacillus sp.]
MILVLGTVLSPIIVALINRGFDVWLSSIHEKQTARKEYYQHKLQIFEQYLHDVAEASRGTVKHENLKIVDSYYLMLPYISTDTANALNKFTIDLANGKKLNEKDLLYFNQLLFEIKRELKPYK